MAGFLGHQLSEAERATLARWQRSEQKVKFVRARILLLAEQTPSAAAVARTVGVHVQTVRDLARVFRAEGLAGLEPKPRPGRPRRFGEPAADTLITLLHEPPEQHGVADGRWTLERAAKVLATRLGVASVGRETVRQLLRRRRHTWQRTKAWIRSTDPQYAAKKNGATG
jgi:transposase